MKYRRSRSPRLAVAPTDTAIGAAIPAILGDYLSPEQLAVELGVSERTVYRWHALRTGPPRVTVGRRPMYKLASVRAWLERRERDPAAAESRRRRA